MSRERLERPNPLTVVAWAKRHPSWGTIWKEANFLATLAGGAGFTRVVSFRVPMGELGVLEGFANGVSNAGDWDALTWQVRINSTATPGLDVIQGPFGYIPVPEPLSIPLMPNQLVEVVVRNDSDTAITNMAALLVGRIFPHEVPEGLIGD
jgi:hypothetical protein